jgi:hypothetical protein
MYEYIRLLWKNVFCLSSTITFAYFSDCKSYCIAFFIFKYRNTSYLTVKAKIATLQPTCAQPSKSLNIFGDYALRPLLGPAM